MPTKYICPAPASSPVVMTLPRETEAWFWNSSGKGKCRNRVVCIWRSLPPPQTNVLLEESFKRILWGAYSTWNASHLWTPTTSLTSSSAVGCLRYPRLGLSNFKSVGKLPGNNFMLCHTGCISSLLLPRFRGEHGGGGGMGIWKLRSGPWVPMFFLRGPVDLIPASDRLLEETESINLC